MMKLPRMKKTVPQPKKVNVKPKYHLKMRDYAGENHVINSDPDSTVLNI